MEVDEAIGKLGLVGKWQFIYYPLIYLIFLFPGSWHIFNIIWIGYKPPHNCKLPVNASMDDWIPKDQDGVFSSCTMYANISLGNETTSCTNGYEYDLAYSGPTFASKWDMVCDRSYLVDTSQTVNACGVLLGSLIFTRISDHFGRKPIIVGIQITLNTIGALTVLSQRFEWYYFLRFFEGVFQQGVIACNVVQVCEMTSTEHRALIAIIGSGLWAVAQCILPLIAYLVRNWVTFQLIISLYGFIFIPLFWWLPETIPWLHANNKVKEAEAILLRAAKMNNITLPTPILKPYHEDGDDVELDGEKGALKEAAPNGVDVTVDVKGNVEGSALSRFRRLFQKSHQPHKHLKIQYSFWELFKNRRLFTFLVICVTFGLVDNLVYYGLILSSNSLSDNHYLNGFFNALIEIPGCIVIYLAVNRFGRKKPMAASHALAGIALLCCVLVEMVFDKKHQGIAIIILSITGKFWISGAFAIDIFYITEIFPTNLRNQAFGVCIFFSRLGNLMASYAAYVAENYPGALSLVFGIVSIAVAVLIVFLPETYGRALPETIEDIEMWYEEDRIKKKRKKDEKKNKKGNPIVKEGALMEAVKSEDDDAAKV